MSRPAKFRRALVWWGRVCIEVGANEFWSLPNPTPDGRRYDPDTVLRAMVRAGEVNLDRWERAQ